MAIPKSIHEAKGLWKGNSRLNLPWLPADKQVSESNSSLHIDSDGNNTYATITYNWSHEGKRQEGTIILSESTDSKAVELGWVDSWHQNSGVLHLVGEESDSGSVKVKGTYGPAKEPWGWTIEFQRAGNQLSMNMDNIKPSGEAIWAVKATYSRD